MKKNQVNPGRLKDRITLQTPTQQEGPFPPLDDYEDYTTIWAEVRFLRGRNFYAAKSANIKTDVEFIIRHRTDLDETMRVVHEGKDYEIEGIVPMDNTSSYMTIRAYEIKHDM